MSKPSRREWKGFEQLVARVETILAPSGARVRCPDRHVTDLDTGALREVDATIRIERGEQTELVALECRRRGRRQTVEWIESLVAKKASIGAARMIGVSSTGFARTAVKKAAVRGVELRTARALDEKVLADWIAFPAVRLVNTRWSVIDVKFHLSHPEPDDQLDSREGAGNKINGDDPVLWVGDDGERISVHEFLRRARGQDPWPEAPLKQILTQRTFVNCQSPFWITTNKGRRQVQAVDALCAFQHVISDGPMVTAISYAKPGDGPILDAVHFDVSALISNGFFAFHRDAATGQTSLSIVLQPAQSELAAKR
jgi:hypothetical protein